MSKFASLRAEIRHITDAVKAPILGNAVFAKLTRRGVTIENFWVTLGQMVECGQVQRHGDAKPYRYSSGTAPVDMEREYRPERSHKLKGFMELKREREARTRAAS